MTCGPAATIFQPGLVTRPAGQSVRLVKYLGTPMKASTQTLKRIATNLYRSDVSGKYYGIFKTTRKQIRRSLKTP